MRRHLASRTVVLLFSLLIGLSAPVFALRFIAFLIFFLVLAASGYLAIVRRSIEIRRRDPEVRGTRLQTLPSRIVVANRRPIPIARVLVIESPRQLRIDQANREIDLPPSQGVEFSEGLRAERRGEYLYGPMRVQGRDPFGFFEWEYAHPEGARAVVFPRILPLLLENRRGAAGGSLPVTDPAYEDVTRFRSLREYVPGDEPKRINWKASAKSGKLYTTEYERTLTVSVLVVLNLMADDYPARRRDHQVERAIEAAAALLFNYTRLNQPVGLIAASAVGDPRAAAGSEPEPLAAPIAFEPKTGWPHAEQMLDLLARAQPARGSIDYLRVLYASGRPAANRLLIVGPPPNPGQIEELRTIRANNLRLELFPVGAESDAEGLRAVEGICPVHRISDGGENLIER